MRLFTQKPSKGLKFFHEKGIVEDSAEAIAKFLLENDRLDKTAIGKNLDKTAFGKIIQPKIFLDL